MATSNLFLFFFTISSQSFSLIFSATVVEDLNKLQPPPNFNSTLTKNCLNNPSLRYCKATPFDVHEIFKSTIVASHLCNVSNNTNCVETFPKIDLHDQPRIAPLYLSFTFFWKYCPLTIMSIDLSNNSLKGNFPMDIFYCTQIKKLDLRQNSLSGDLPIMNFSVFENLTSLNLSYNEFSESKISDKQFFTRFNSSSFINSGIVPNHNEYRIKIVLLFVCFPVFVIVVVVCSVWLCFSRPDFLPRCLRRKNMFTPAIVRAATNEFSKRNLVRKNGTVSVYKGILGDETVVRIKVYFDHVTRESRSKFVEESKVLVQLRHRNVTRILGWCDNRKFRAVVAKWIDGEDVETWLLTCNPPWIHRVKVMLGVAAGICYLHEEWPEVGYNLKLRNIVVSSEGEPFIAKFKFNDHHNSTKKIYKFGVFMLEMVANIRRPLEEFERGESGFVEWAKMNFPDNMENLVDKRMKKSERILMECAKVIEFGLVCTDLSSGRQPMWDQMLDMVSNITCMAKSESSDHHGKRSRGDHSQRDYRHVHG